MQEFENQNHLEGQEGSSQIGAPSPYQAQSANPSTAQHIPSQAHQMPGQAQQTVLTVQAPKMRAKTVALVAATVLCVILCVSCISCTALFGGMVSSVGVSAGEGALDSSPKIAVISLGSTIQYDGTSCSPSGLKNLLDQADQRDDIKGVVLRINSGGGTATAGEEMSKYVKDFQKPIVVSCAATTASAAYEIASQSDYIYAAKTSSVGSIGVAMQVTNLSGLYDKLGIDIDTITSSESKDSTYGNRALTKSERQWYQQMVDQIDADFIETVATGRNMSVEDVRKLANGLSYTGTEAVENGLVNEIGYLDDAVKKASEIAGFEVPLNQTPLTLKSSPDISSILDILGEESAGSTENGAIEGSVTSLEETK